MPTSASAEFAGRLRTVPISRENPLEIVEFDEIGALIRYIGDRKLREAITERVALLTTQGRALGYTVRGYVQEPTKDTVPVRELFPRRICLRVAAKSHVGMVLGDQAYERGAWANRIGESEPGVGYLFGEGIREPLRVRGGWVPDETINDLESFVTGHTPPSRPGTVHAFPTHADRARHAPAAWPEPLASKGFLCHDTNTLPVPSTLDLLLGGFRAHLHGRILPAPVARVLPRQRRRDRRAARGRARPGPQARQRPALGRTRSPRSAPSGRTPTRRPVHVTVRGRTTSGARVQVYGGGDFTECLGLVQLAPGEREGVSLDELFALVCLLREAQREREVACMTGHQTRAERMRQPLASDVIAATAEQHGVCVRPFTMEVGDLDTGELRYVAVPCGSTVESQCGPCARKARALRMVAVPGGLAPHRRTRLHPG